MHALFVIIVYKHWISRNSIEPEDTFHNSTRFVFFFRESKRDSFESLFEFITIDTDKSDPKRGKKMSLKAQFAEGKSNTIQPNKMIYSNKKLFDVVILYRRKSVMLPWAVVVWG